MSETTQPLSIHALPIVNIGGTPARIGFNVQDHVAARYCIELDIPLTQLAPICSGGPLTVLTIDS